eukprot:GEMP01024264.1.p1 GENE.GEMP01024264.1~~GEMP01024264.1.p1  ORF type:complete len:538 (+),score=86.45 GEMP01024264.1:58-1671(+)
MSGATLDPTYFPSEPLGGGSRDGENPPWETDALQNGTGNFGQASASPLSLSDKQADFEHMVGDLRDVFVSWLKRWETDISEAREQLERDKRNFEEEKTRVWKLFMAEKQREWERLSVEKRKIDQDATISKKQIQMERDDARKKIADDRATLEKERDQLRRKFMIEKERFRQEVEAFELQKQKIHDQHLASEQIVDINVGGTVFETAKVTLTKQEGFLEGLLSGRHQPARDRHGRVFIDRDSEHFRTLLNFLRNPTVPPLPNNPGDSEALVKEADYYGIRFFEFPLVFACGGHSGYEHLKEMEVLDVGNRCWRPCRPMNTERTYFGSAELYSRLYLFGGQNLDYKALSEVEIYDCMRDTWMQGASLSKPRRNCTSATLDDKIYAIGGFDGSTILSSVECYDQRMKTWVQCGDLSTPRSSPMSTVYDGKLWAIGGTSGTRLRTVEWFEPRLNRWQPFNCDLLEVRSAGQAVTCLGQIYVMGGTDNRQTMHYSIEELDTQAVRWSFKKDMQVARMDFASVVISDSTTFALVFSPGYVIST